jgi:DNA-binding LacI/PurR family transcriptional regulator/DNA-binding transcriptional regulator YhcF (GntR family)
MILCIATNNDFKTMTQQLEETVAKRERIAMHLRQQIVSGHYGPCDRLPTRRELERSFAVSTITIQSALDVLQRDGFVDAQGRRGTFVSERPPHLHQYALAFPCRQGDPLLWNRFWQALVNEASSPEFASDLHLYFNVDEDPEPNEARRELEADVAAHRVAGVVFARLPFNLTESPLLKTPGIPLVAIASRAEGMACIYPNHAALIERGLNDLMAQGRKRIAVLLAEGLLEGQVGHIEAVLKRNGVEIPPFWIQRAALHTPASARGIVHLLMQGNPNPDGLLILDDNLVEGACAGLIAAGVRVPQDVDVVAHHNFPLPSTGALPIHRIGFDARAILRECMELIAMQRRGETPLALNLVPASFEEEMEAAVGAPVRG